MQNITGTRTAVAAAAAGITVVAQGAVYSGQYLYEFAKWDNEAKGRAFRRQFVAHVTKYEEAIVDRTSAICSNQVGK
jgi:hypothetical protein